MSWLFGWGSKTAEDPPKDDNEHEESKNCFVKKPATEAFKHAQQPLDMPFSVASKD